MYCIYNLFLYVQQKMKIFFVIIYALLKEVMANKYDRYKIYHVYPQTDTHLQVLEQMRNTPDYDFLSRYKVLYRPAVILTSPSTEERFLATMKKHNFYFMPLYDDVGRQLTRQYVKKYRLYRKRDDFSIRKYNSYKKIKAYLWHLQSAYPDKIRVVSIGSTFENRQIILVKISKNPERVGIRPAIFIDAGIHAREWIAPATALYLIHNLVESASNEEMISTVDWYIVPLVNPDGYEYSLTVDRLWRKNRSRNKFCRGVDPNRNFDFHWNEGGSSSDECSEIYAGVQPFTEAESIALRDFIFHHRDTIKLYITLHSYGNFILYPWNYKAATPTNKNELDQLAKKVSEAIEVVNGNRYIYGTSYKVLYQASGNSEDWVRGVAGIQLSYAIELYGGGDTGFDVPEKMIPIVGKEMFAGFKAFWEYIVFKFKLIYDGRDK